MDVAAGRAVGIRFSGTRVPKDVRKVARRNTSRFRNETWKMADDGVWRIVNGDIGGTNARMQLWTAAPALEVPPLRAFTLTTTTVYPSASFPGLAALLLRFLVDEKIIGANGEFQGQRVQACCLAVCGPVVDETQMVGPTLPEQPPTQWKACKQDCTTGIFAGIVLNACLLNDFMAVGLGLTDLGEDDIVLLHDAPRIPRAPMVRRRDTDFSLYARLHIRSFSSNSAAGLCRRRHRVGGGLFNLAGIRLIRYIDV